LEVLEKAHDLRNALSVPFTIGACRELEGLRGPERALERRIGLDIAVIMIDLLKLGRAPRSEQSSLKVRLGCALWPPMNSPSNPNLEVIALMRSATASMVETRSNSPTNWSASCPKVSADCAIIVAFPRDNCG
jgi:hypothetical protein